MSDEPLHCRNCGRVKEEHLKRAIRGKGAPKPTEYLFLCPGKPEPPTLWLPPIDEL